jgi:hypothetical protein
MTLPLSADARREVARRAGHSCSYCRSREAVVGASFTVDHIIPQALGGSDALDNLCLACWDCNRRYLLDTNIWLERMLDQEHAPDVAFPPGFNDR